MSLVRQREPWSRFVPKAILVVGIVLIALAWVESRYRIGIDSQAIRCFPDHKFFLVDLKLKAPERDKIIAYRAKGLLPYFADQTLMGKVIKGIPGDHLQINESGVYINQIQLADAFPLIERLGVEEASLYRDEIVPAGHYFLMAPAPESYDSRYWGYISEDQIEGKATPFL